MLSIEKNSHDGYVIVDGEIVRFVELGKKELSSDVFDIYESATSIEYKNLMKFELLVKKYDLFQYKLLEIDELIASDDTHDIDKLRELLFGLIVDRSYIKSLSEDLSLRECPVSLIVDDRVIFGLFNEVTMGEALIDADIAYSDFLTKCSENMDERIYNLIDLICNWDFSAFTISDKLQSILFLNRSSCFCL